MTRKSTSQEAVRVSESTNTADLAIVLPERDPEVEYEDWTTEVLSPAKAFYATTTTGYNNDQPSYERAMKGPEASLWKQGLQSEYDSLIERNSRNDRNSRVTFTFHSVFLIRRPKLPQQLCRLLRLLSNNKMTYILHFNDIALPTTKL
jgi:hypothetical protein